VSPFNGYHATNPSIDVYEKETIVIVDNKQINTNIIFIRILFPEKMFH